MKDIKRRMKSVESTMQITKAMELVASSKVRRAKERVEASRPFFDTLFETIRGVAASGSEFQSIYTQARPVHRSGFVVIAGDRGLAGGYNTNVLNFALEMIGDKEPVIIPVGRKTADFFAKRGIQVLQTPYPSIEEMDMDGAIDLGRMVGNLYCKGDIDELYIVYTEFVSMLSQQPACRKMLPLSFEETDGRGKPPARDTLFEPSAAAVFDEIVPQYVGGLLFGAISESFASEQSARRMAMEAATDNAEEMIADLSLRYNRARQGSITQEITEIVGGAEALN